MKSNQVIFGNLSNSGIKHLIIGFLLVLVVLQLTKYSWFSKEDVHNGDILLVGIVVCLVLIVEWGLVWAIFGQHTLVSDDMSSLSPMDPGYFGLSGPVVLLL